LLGSLLIFFLVSLVGIPFTGGFFGKFYSFAAAVGGGAIWLAILGLLNSGLAAAYYLRLALATAQRPDDQTSAAPTPRVGVAVGAALLLAVAATLVLGIVPGDVLHAAESGAHTLQAPPVEISSPEIPAGPQTQR
jgi:NADH-quinone oxidoreductase subunit N